ncbi:AGAP010966-PA-like protein [Anopheles sinensis]|uniref:AGAP010966-PA-like protein n=1 Tax=Anopheles sinensis TaxID=74873 RepID=A0A084WQY5_ANOSI|nr:AGAP010966-PA-like protein [Anopheles sinensis]
MIVSAILVVGLFYHNPLAAVPIVVVLGLLYWLVKYNYRFWEIDGVPHPKPSMLTGNLAPALLMKKHICQLASDWYNAYPNATFVGYFKQFTPAIMVRDPELVKNILTRDFECFASNDFVLDTAQDPLLAHDAFFATGSQWKRARTLLTPSFTGAKIKQLFPIMNSVAEAFETYVGQHVAKELEAKELAARFTTQNVVACTFGVDGECFAESESEFRRMGKKVFETSLLATIRLILSLFLPAIAQRIPVPFLLKDVDQWIRSLVSSQVQKRSKMEDEGASNNDLLQSLINNREKQNISQTELTGHALTIFLEGFETSSAVIGCALYQLAINPEEQERLYLEIQKQLEANEGKVDFDVLQKIEYLEWVVLETLRMHPPAAIMQKLSTQKYIMRRGQRDSQGHDMGVYVREGTPILIPILAIHMDPKYHPEPQKFDPERFSPERKVEHRGTVFLPFGEGPRMCLGMRFAQAQVKLALLKLILSYRVRTGPNHKPFAVDPRSIIYQSKYGLRLVFEKR